MKITETRIFIKDGKDKKLKAYATVTLDDAFVVRNIKVIQGGIRDVYRNAIAED